MEMVKPKYDLGATGRTSVDPSVCGVSSDLQNLNLSESGVSGNPRNDLSPASPKPESESDPMDVVATKEQTVMPYLGPHVLKCEICHRNHDEFVCPYLDEFPVGAQLHNHRDYFIFCDHCRNEVVGGHCPRHPNSKKRVAPTGRDRYGFFLSLDKAVLPI